MQLTSTVSRRRFLELCGSVALAGLASTVYSQKTVSRSAKALRVGAVLPSLSGPYPQGGFGADVVGPIANMGALLASETLPNEPTLADHQLDVLITSAPGSGAALRAAERLSGVEEVYGIVGGFNEEEAKELADLAERRGILFINVGAQSDSLRNEYCSRNMFHVEASARMYLDAAAEMYVGSNHKRWLLVYSDDLEQKANLQSALAALSERGIRGEALRTVMVPEGEPLFTDVFDEIRSSGADTVLLLLAPETQLTFVGQYATSGLSASAVGFPSPAAQTRLFYAMELRQGGPVARDHLALWDATLVGHGAQDLNQRFLARFGQAMGPAAWAAYVGVKILAEAAAAVGSTDSVPLVSYLESPRAQLDVDKGPGTTFRSWDHQLRQPLYTVETDPSYRDKSSLQDLAHVTRVVPTVDSAGRTPGRSLDLLGVGQSASTCKL